MKYFKNIEVRNLIIDIVIIILAFQFLDISDFVIKSFPHLIYFLIIFQSLTYWLLYSSEKFQKFEKKEEAKPFIDKFRELIYIIPGFSMMFYFVIGWIWILLPVEYLDYQTKTRNDWVFTFSGIVGFLCGILVLTRMFANSYHSSEKDSLLGFSDLFNSRHPIAERIIHPIYGLIMYGNFADEKIREWLGYFIGFAFLVYTETLFEIMINDAKFMDRGETSTVGLFYLALFFSFFPVRLLMLVKPPFSLIEVVSAFITFGIFLYAIHF